MTLVQKDVRLRIILMIDTQTPDLLLPHISSLQTHTGGMLADWRATAACLRRVYTEPSSAASFSSTVRGSARYASLSRILIRFLSVAGTQNTTSIHMQVSTSRAIREPTLSAHINIKSMIRFPRMRNTASAPEPR